VLEVGKAWRNHGKCSSCGVDLISLDGIDVISEEFDFQVVSNCERS